MSTWTKFATKVYNDNKKKNKDFKFSDALKLASKQYKKQRGGKKSDEGDVDEDVSVPADAGVPPVEDVVPANPLVRETATGNNVDDAVPAVVDEDAIDTTEGGKKKRKSQRGGKSKKSQKKNQRKSKKTHRK
jgi:hypothetical protein